MLSSYGMNGRGPGFPVNLSIMTDDSTETQDGLYPRRLDGDVSHFSPHAASAIKA
jgi:hypothetical protein